ncbi:MAG: aminotransferase class IV [Candidatus Eremiobacteraeota bacterium]|nr:aminotransferase class IV [Candidatus Eremiobacteraeota bacterium]
MPEKSPQGKKVIIVTAVSINGTITAAEEAKIPVFDHGFLYGDSIYETIRTYGKAPFLLKEHLERLARSGQAIELTIPFTLEECAAEMKRLAHHVEAEEYLYRVMVTRGEGKPGYRLDKLQKPTTVMICFEFKGFSPEYYRKGITLYTATVKRNDVACLNPAIKSGNLLNVRLAYMDAHRKGGDEALMLNLNNEIAECSSSNVFFVREGVLLTPALESGLLPGITRQFILRLALEIGITAREERLPADIISGCSECFVSSTIKALLPVRKVDETLFACPGEITGRLMEAFGRATRQSG